MIIRYVWEAKCDQFGNRTSRIFAPDVAGLNAKRLRLVACRSSSMLMTMYHMYHMASLVFSHTCIWCPLCLVFLSTPFTLCSTCILLNIQWACWLHFFLAFVCFMYSQSTFHSHVALLFVQKHHANVCFTERERESLCLVPTEVIALNFLLLVYILVIMLSDHSPPILIKSSRYQKLPAISKAPYDHLKKSVSCVILLLFFHISLLSQSTFPWLFHGTLCPWFALGILYGLSTYTFPMYHQTALFLKGFVVCLCGLC